MKFVKIFVSSPGDVLPERHRAEQVIRRLGLRFGQALTLEPIFWEWEPLTAGRHFQENIVPPSATDLVVLIVWSRLGTPLPLEKFHGRITGNQVTGTEWEFEDALGAFNEGGRPDMLVYIKKARVDASFDDPDDPRIDEMRADKRRLDRFLRHWFWDEQAKVFKGSQRDFRDTTEFEEMLERHLEKVLLAKTTEVGRAKASGGYWLGGSPFRGLQPFDVEHSAIFFGRTRARNDLRDALVAQAGRGAAFVAVVGGSGSGKSSLVKAGLIPDLCLTGMVPGVVLVRYAILRPRDQEANPVAALAGAILEALPELLALQYTQSSLAAFVDAGVDIALPVKQGLQAATVERADPAGARRLLIVVDQLEELFTYPIADEVRRRFVAALDGLARSTAAWVVTTIRSDYVARLAELPQLSELARGPVTFLLSPPTAEELGQIILRPAELAGLEFETDLRSGRSLDEELRRAAGANPGALPLLEYVLDRLWRERSADGRLTFEAYERLGGFEGAIGRRAEELFVALPLDVQEALPEVLRALVATTWSESESAASSRTAPIASFTEGSAARRLVDALQAQEARLLVVDGDRVRVAHEALLHRWERAARQIAEDRHDLRTRDRLEREAAEWLQPAAGDRSDLLIPSGVRLADAGDLLTRRGNELSGPVRRFVEASLQANSDREQRELMLERQHRLDAEIRQTRAEAAEKLAEAERGFARAAKNRALARHVTAQRSRPDRERYVQRLKQGARQFERHADAAWRAAHAMTSRLESVTRGDAEDQRAPLASDERIEIDVVANGGQGASYLLRYGAGKAIRHVIVEGGAAFAYKEGLRARLEALRGAAAPSEGLTIELALISHYDMDRVAGIAQLLQELVAAKLAGVPALFNVKAIWFNHFLPEDMEKPRRPTGEKRATPKEQIPALAAELGIAVNDPFDYFVMASEYGPARVKLADGLSATVIAPDAAWLQRWYQNWSRSEKRRVDVSGPDRVQQTSFDLPDDSDLTTLDDAVASISEGFSSPEIELLRAPPDVTTVTPPDRPDMAVANLSSIVALFEYRGRKALFCGDSRADQIVGGLSKASQLSGDGSLHLDALQVPHFGSKGNVSPEFFRRVTADHYIIVPHRHFRLPDESAFFMIADARGAAEFRIHLPPFALLPWLKPRAWDKRLRARLVVHESDTFTLPLT